MVKINKNKLLEFEDAMRTMRAYKKQILPKKSGGYV
jgi:hypothetical protein